MSARASPPVGDVDLVQHVVAELVEVRAAGRALQRHVVRDQGDGVRAVRADEGVEVGAVGDRILGDLGSFAVRRHGGPFKGPRTCAGRQGRMSQRCRGRGAGDTGGELAVVHHDLALAAHDGDLATVGITDVGDERTGGASRDGRGLGLSLGGDGGGTTAAAPAPARTRKPRRVVSFIDASFCVSISRRGDVGIGRPGGGRTLRRHPAAHHPHPPMWETAKSRRRGPREGPVRRQCGTGESTSASPPPLVGTKVPTVQLRTAAPRIAAIRAAPGDAGSSSIGVGSARHQLSRSVVPWMLGRVSTPRASSSVAVSSVHGAWARARQAPLTTSSAEVFGARAASSASFVRSR